MVKTASLLVRKKPTSVNNLSIVVNQVKSRLFLILLFFLLSSCSSSQKVSKEIDKGLNTDIEKITVDSGTLTALQRVELAQTLPSTEALNELIIASKLFFQQRNYVKSLWIADKTLPIIDETTPDYIHEKIQLSLIKASSLQQLGYYSESHVQLQELAQFSDNKKVPLTATYYRLLSAAFQDINRPIASLNAQLFVFSLTDKNKQNQQQIEAIWYDFQRLSQWQLKLLANDKPPGSEGWLQLISLANKYGDNHKQMQYHLSMWQKKFKLHPANSIALQLNEQEVTATLIRNIAVIIPLTGTQKSAGLAIQQGILASFEGYLEGNEAKQLHFIDSNTVNWYSLNNKFSELGIDYVIGPLLKSNVDKYISHTSAQTHSQNNSLLDAAPKLFNLKNVDQFTNKNQDKHKNTNDYLKVNSDDSSVSDYLQPHENPQAIPTLLLNMPTNTSLTNQHTVLSMRPEDEASQAAASLSRKNYKHPIVLSQKNVVSKRIAQAFVKQWHRITGDTINVVYYDTGAQMQANISASLAVDESKVRINKLKSRLNQTVKTQTRNRQDIDMIYLVGTSEQTRLVKPYIEVNISPFAKGIPVFASSRSHSTKSDYSSNSDLRGLIFTQIPWLLADERNNELGMLSQALWPKRSDGLSRLFAMGFDSYKLISKIPLMQQAPYIQHWGQTGVLKLDDNNVLTRSMLWGVYQRNKVTSIAME